MLKRKDLMLAVARNGVLPDGSWCGISATCCCTADDWSSADDCCCRSSGLEYDGAAGLHVAHAAAGCDLAWHWYVVVVD